MPVPLCLTKSSLTDLSFPYHDINFRRAFCCCGKRIDLISYTSHITNRLFVLLKQAFILALLLDNCNLLLLLSSLYYNFKYFEISFLRGQDYRCSLLWYFVWTEYFEINSTVVLYMSVLFALLWFNPRDSLKWVRQVPMGPEGEIGSLRDGITGICELPDVSPGIWTLALIEEKVLFTTEPSRQPLHFW